MTLVTLFRCDGNSESDPTKLPIWCGKLFWPGAKSIITVPHKTKSDRHLCVECAKNLVSLDVPKFKKGKLLT